MSCDDGTGPEGEGQEGQGSDAPPASSPRSDARAALQAGPMPQARVTDERVATIVDMMSRGVWHTRASARGLAEQWGVSIPRVRSLAAEASRQIRQASDLEEALEQRAATIGRLERLSALAEDSADLKTAVRAEAERAKVAGLIASEVRAVVLVPIGGAEVKATVEELRALLGHVDAFLRERHPGVARELGAYLQTVKA